MTLSSCKKLQKRKGTQFLQGLTDLSSQNYKRTGKKKTLPSLKMTLFFFFYCRNVCTSDEQILKFLWKEKDFSQINKCRCHHQFAQTSAAHKFRTKFLIILVPAEPACSFSTQSAKQNFPTPRDRFCFERNHSCNGRWLCSRLQCLYLVFLSLKPCPFSRSTELVL